MLYYIFVCSLIVVKYPLYLSHFKGMMRTSFLVIVGKWYQLLFHINSFWYKALSYSRYLCSTTWSLDTYSLGFWPPKYHSRKKGDPGFPDVAYVESSFTILPFFNRISFFLPTLLLTWLYVWKVFLTSHCHFSLI